MTQEEQDQKFTEYSKEFQERQAQFEKELLESMNRERATTADGQPVNYAILHWDTEKFVGWYAERTGKVTMVKNPFKANYFLHREDAEKWLDKIELDKK